ncbi:MAG TPA: sigma-54 dependent transcriptional regulator [Kofleriaceae bacterium]
MAEPARILIVDDKLALAETLADGLADRGYAARALGASKDALAELRAGRADLLVTDLRMPEVDGFALLDAARELDRELPVIVMTAYGAIDSAVEAIRRGAYHYLTKPFKLDELLVFVERALADRALRREAAELRDVVDHRFSRAGLTSASPAMQDVLRVIDRVAASDVALLVTGKVGTGKTTVARAIHNESPRAKGPFVMVNSAAIPESLLESELFGHVKGAYTGATTDRPGLFAEADRGTLLLDEIGEMSPALQAKLLHVLETGRIRPVGSSGERAVDVRVITATHRDLHALVREGRFREDLLYRLDVVELAIPPLVARREDIPLLADALLADALRRNPRSSVRAIGKSALARLVDYSWPGNVRELSHVIERAVVLATGDELTERDLPDDVCAPAPSAPEFNGEILAMRELQRRYARWALDRLGGNKSRTADQLEVDVKTLSKLLTD